MASSDEELQHAISIRQSVFVEEQDVPIEEELDEFDSTATHFVLYTQNKPIGTGRCRLIYNTMKVERICVLKSLRRSGAGKQIMLAIEHYAQNEGVSILKLDAQTHAEGFYQKLGYRTTSEEFLDAGIPHVSMTKNLK